LEQIRGFHIAGIQAQGFASVVGGLGEVVRGQGILSLAEQKPDLILPALQRLGFLDALQQLLCASALGFQKEHFFGANGSALRAINVQIADLPGANLGLASGHTITLDDNAAGWGWFVDPTPHSDSEFTTPGNQGEQNRMDLLTVLEHEAGHILGKEHEETGVMIDILPAGTRRSPGSAASLSDWSGAEWLSVFADLESPSFHKRR